MCGTWALASGLRPQRGLCRIESAIRSVVCRPAEPVLGPFASLLRVSDYLQELERIDERFESIERVLDRTVCSYIY